MQIKYANMQMYVSKCQLHIKNSVIFVLIFCGAKSHSIRNRLLSVISNRKYSICSVIITFFHFEIHAHIIEVHKWLKPKIFNIECEKPEIVLRNGMNTEIFLPKV